MSNIDIDRVVGHKGAGDLTPENTLLAFKRAAEMGLKHTEFDVRLTADGVPVLSNRETLLFCTGKDIEISKSNYSDLLGLDVAHYHEATSETCVIPRLDEAVSLLRELGLHAQIELKTVQGLEITLAETVAPILDQVYANSSTEELPLITSFSPLALNTLTETATLPYETGLLIHTEKIDEWEDTAAETHCHYVHIYGGLTEKFGQSIRGAGYGLNAYKVNSVEDAISVIKAGAERFTSDRPELFLKPNR